MASPVGIYRARHEGERQVTEAAKQQQPGMANTTPSKPSEDHPRRSVMNLRLGMSLKQALEAFKTNKPAFEVDPYEQQEARDLPGSRYVPTLTGRATTTHGGSDWCELTFSPPTSTESTHTNLMPAGVLEEGGGNEGPFHRQLCKTSTGRLNISRFTAV